jgi:acyl-CoA synthetase (AMP-forming)/AMP-acid ligase II
MSSGADATSVAPSLAAMATAIAEAHGVAPLDIVLVPSGAIARTLSGKLQREQTRAAYQSGTLPILARHAPNRPRPAV